MRAFSDMQLMLQYWNSLSMSVCTYAEPVIAYDLKMPRASISSGIV